MLEDILKRVETGMTTVKDAEFLRAYIAEAKALLAATPEDNIIERKSFEAVIASLESENAALPKPLPCPFCGSRNVICHEGSTYNWWVAECKNCGARGPEVRRYMDGEVSADERAIGEWNIRSFVFTKTRYTLNEFKELVARNSWRFTDVIEVESEEDLGSQRRRFIGCAGRVAEFGGFVITKEEDFNLCSNDPSSLMTSDHRWTMEGFTVIDNNGKELDATALAKHLPKEFKEIDYSKFYDENAGCEKTFAGY